MVNTRAFGACVLGSSPNTPATLLKEFIWISQ